jgi:LSD1 subclass zinc finger protein
MTQEANFDAASASTNQNELICKNCNAKLVFAPGSTSLKCEYCGTENEIEIKEEEIEEQDFNAMLDQLASSDEMVEQAVVKCNGCGAETTLDPNVTADTCAFCGTPLVLSEGTTCSLIKPKSLLPFKVERQEARKLFKKWISKLWFAPNGIKKYARQLEKLAGMYIPHWTYDSDTNTYYTGQRGDNYTETESYTDSNGETKERRVTKTDWTYVSGNVYQFFDDVLVVASLSLPTKYMRKLEPWDLENLVPFDPKFLSGFKSESYQVDLKEGLKEAEKTMEKTIRKLIKKDIGGDKQRISTLNIQHNDLKFKHLLLPVWISSYRFKGKVYRFMVNARTGEVQGERPYSFWKIFFAVLAGLVILGGAGYLIYMNAK